MPCVLVVLEWKETTDTSLGQQAGAGRGRRLGAKAYTKHLVFWGGCQRGPTDNSKGANKDRDPWPAALQDVTDAPLMD